MPGNQPNHFQCYLREYWEELAPREQKTLGVWAVRCLGKLGKPDFSSSVGFMPPLRGTKRSCGRRSSLEELLPNVSDILNSCQMDDLPILT